MRRRFQVGIPTVLAAMLAVLPVVALASSAVLTSGGPGSDGLRVMPGAQLGMRATGGATFASGTSGGAVTCSASDVAATLLANPAAPGTARLSVTSFSFSGCTSTIEGTTSVESASFDNLPYRMSISDATSPPTATLRPGDGGPILLTLDLGTASRPVHCIYEPRGSSISTVLTTDGVTFDVPFVVALPMQIPTEPCGHIGGYAGAYGPLFEPGHMQQRVFVN